MRALLEGKIDGLTSSTEKKDGNVKEDERAEKAEESGHNLKQQSTPRKKTEEATPQWKEKDKRKRQGPANSSSNAASEAEREIAELEREAGGGNASVDSSVGAAAREQKLSEGARKHDLAIFEHIIQTSLLLQKAAPPIHRSFPSLPRLRSNVPLLLNHS